MVVCGNFHPEYKKIYLWHALKPTCQNPPPPRPSIEFWVQQTVEMGNIEQAFNFKVKLKIHRDVL